MRSERLASRSARHCLELLCNTVLDAEFKVIYKAASLLLANIDVKRCLRVLFGHLSDFHISDESS